LDNLGTHVKINLLLRYGFFFGVEIDFIGL
jgi:hypothetical protein